MKAIVRWMQATPLWNGGSLPNDTRVFKSEYGYDLKRWEAAREAAKAVLEAKKEDGSNRYQLYTKYDASDFKDIDGKSNTKFSSVYGV